MLNMQPPTYNRKSWAVSACVIFELLIIAGVILQFQPVNNPAAAQKNSTTQQGASQTSRYQNSSAKVKLPCPTLTNTSNCIGPETIGDSSWRFEPPNRLKNACQQNAMLPLLVFVPVAAHMTAQRSTLRRTWGSGFSHLIFVVQLGNDRPITEKLSSEINQFGDIFLVRAPVEDSYHCLTLKVLAFLRWFNSQCSRGFLYLLKSDHDSYWHTKSVMRLVKKRLTRAVSVSDRRKQRGPSRSPLDAMNSTGVPEIIGAIQSNAAVNRNPASKFCTPIKSYASSSYPTYASGGPGYLLSREAVALIIAESERSNAPSPFWLEDVYITGILAEGSVRTFNNSSESNAKSNIFHVNYSSIVHYQSQSLEAMFNNPPLGVHGLSMLQLHQMHCLMRLPEAVNRAKELHKFE